MRKLWNPAHWAGFVPNGLGEIKPNHYLEVFEAIWRNRDQLPFAWRILRDGVCDGCALGTTGLRDFTMTGVHLCTVRLGLLRLNTMRAMNPEILQDVGRLKGKTGKELRELGRLAYPMMRRSGDAGFRRVTWDEAMEAIASRIRFSDPRRIGLYLTSRGITNETYYVAQKVARFLGTNNVDNSARLCHAPSTVAMKETLGVAASTCSYKDWIGSDLLVFLGSDVPNNQPVTTKYLYYAKKRGTKIVVVNPLREPGLERYWVPSVLESALFGTRLADEFFSVRAGGDIAFLNGVLKALIDDGSLDETFMARHTTGFDSVRAELDGQSWVQLEKGSGACREAMQRFAGLYAQARSCVFIWSMGITQHVFGVENVKAIVNLALARGMVGREHCGLMPIRGHSGVQGGSEVGCAPGSFPGGEPIGEQSARRLSELWGFPVPAWGGLTAVEMIEAAERGELDLLYAAGGNFLETLPDPGFVRRAIRNLPVRVHQDLVLTPPMLEEPAELVVLLPAQTRYEQRGGGTETSTERYILFSPEIPGRRVGESRPEWEILMELAKRVSPDRSRLIHFDSAEAVRMEIAKHVPFYEGIQKLRKKGAAVQWGGRILCRDGRFGTADGKARFSPVRLPENAIPEGRFHLSTRRGKQFNSMVDKSYDPLTGARRDEIFLNPEDAGALALREGDPILLRSDAGELRGRVKLMPIQTRNVQAYWPECNGLLKRERREPLSGIPDYNAFVEVIALSEDDAGH